MATNKKQQFEHVYPDSLNRQVRPQPSIGEVKWIIKPRYDPKKDSACISACEKIRANLSKESKRLVLSPKKYKELKIYTYERDNYSCVCCGSTEMPSLHHVISRGRKGNDSPNNVVTLCIPCHMKIEQSQIELPALVVEMLECEPLNLR